MRPGTRDAFFARQASQEHDSKPGPGRPPWPIVRRSAHAGCCAASRRWPSRPTTPSRRSKKIDREAEERARKQRKFIPLHDWELRGFITPEQAAAGYFYQAAQLDSRSTVVSTALLEQSRRSASVGPGGGDAPPRGGAP